MKCDIFLMILKYLLTCFSEKKGMRRPNLTKHMRVFHNPVKKTFTPSPLVIYVFICVIFCWKSSQYLIFLYVTKFSHKKLICKPNSVFKRFLFSSDNKLSLFVTRFPIYLNFLYDRKKLHCKFL
jgi:hypothetical protein